VFGSRAGDEKAGFSKAYDVFERIQMCGFCAQELFLSGLYIWKALDILRAAEQRRSHRLMWQLFAINIIIVMLDIALLAFEFSNHHVIQQTVKGLAYSIKLKLELAILSKLIELSCRNPRVSDFTFGDTNEFLDPTKTVWDITRFTPNFSSTKYTYPKWKSDLERSGLQRVESAYSPTDTTWMKARHTKVATTEHSEYFPDVIQLFNLVKDPRLDFRARGSASDLLYADAVHKIATPR
jgi:hypothetical protein